MSSWKELTLLLPVRADDVADFEPRRDTDQFLQGWAAEDLERLGLKALRLLEVGALNAQGQEHGGQDQSPGIRRLRPTRGN